MQIFRGARTDQDFRFRNKTDALLKSVHFDSILSELHIEYEKLNLELLQPIIERMVTDAVGNEDEIVTSLCVNMLEAHTPPKELQIAMQGFMGKQAKQFMAQLWRMLADAATSQHGIPQKMVQENMTQLQKMRQEHRDDQEKVAHTAKQLTARAEQQMNEHSDPKTLLLEKRKRERGRESAADGAAKNNDMQSMSHTAQHAAAKPPEEQMHKRNHHTDRIPEVNRTNNRVHAEYSKDCDYENRYTQRYRGDGDERHDTGFDRSLRDSCEDSEKVRFRRKRSPYAHSNRRALSPPRRRVDNRDRFDDRERSRGRRTSREHRQERYVYRNDRHDRSRSRSTESRLRRRSFDCHVDGRSIDYHHDPNVRADSRPAQSNESERSRYFGSDSRSNLRASYCTGRASGHERTSEREDRQFSRPRRSPLPTGADHKHRVRSSSRSRSPNFPKQSLVQDKNMLPHSPSFENANYSNVSSPAVALSPCYEFNSFPTLDDSEPATADFSTTKASALPFLPKAGEGNASDIAEVRARAQEKKLNIIDPKGIVDNTALYS